MDPPKQTLAACYLRCSTDSQDTSLEQQEDSIARYARAKGYEIIAKYADEGDSGTLTDRPALNAMAQDAANPETEWKVLLCYDRSRWGRFDHYYEAVAKEMHLIHHGKRLECVQAQYSEDIAGAIMRLLADDQATQERRQILTRLQRGRAHATQQGNWVKGRPPFGYDLLRIRDGKQSRSHLVVNEGQATVVRRIYRLRKGGLTLRAIAGKLNAEQIPTPQGGRLWSPEGIRIILSNPVYRGRMEFTGTRWGVDYTVEGPCPPILAEGE